jgi:hypothetical protein
LKYSTFDYDYEHRFAEHAHEHDIKLRTESTRDSHLVGGERHMAEKKPLEERVIIAGFGGQGIMFMGKLLCYAGMMEGKQVTYLPSYGAEVRGGTAYCNVIVSSAAIASPVISSPPPRSS